MQVYATLPHQGNHQMHYSVFVVKSQPIMTMGLNLEISLLQPWLCSREFAYFTEFNIHYQ